MTGKINVLIVDDDPLARGSIRRMLKKYCPEVNVGGEADSAVEARAMLNNSEFHALFLDISMPDENGFDLLDSIDSSKYMVVFTTSYDQYTIKAMRANAVDYLLKPVEAKELRYAVEKMIKIADGKIKPPQSADHKPELETRVNHVHKKYLTRLTLPDMNGFTIVEVKDIMYLEADNNYTVFHFSNRSKIVVSKPIKQYEDVLDPLVFFRIHKSSIINLRHLKEFSKIDGYYALMTDDNSVPVSRRRLPDFIRAVGAFNIL